MKVICTLKNGQAIPRQEKIKTSKQVNDAISTALRSKGIIPTSVRVQFK